MLAAIVVQSLAAGLLDTLAHRPARWRPPTAGAPNGRPD